MKLTRLIFLLALLPAFLAPSLRADEEQDLIDVLQSNAGASQKCQACQKLRVVATVKSVPVLATLLNDERISQAARYALEGLPGPEPTAALRDALSRTTGAAKSGIIDSLGWRRDTEAVVLIRPFLLDADATLASASATALGRIGGSQALDALNAARDKVAPGVRPAVLESLLRTAEHLLSEGKPYEAAKLYQSLTASTESDAIRIAAWTGSYRAAGPAALAQVEAALLGTDPAAQTAALRVAGDLRGPNATRTFTGLLPKSTPALQIALLALLQRHGDATALPAVLSAARSADPAVQAAALTASGALGDASVIPILAEAATAGDGPAPAAARQALIQLRPPVGEAMVAHLATSKPAVQLEIIRALTARREVSTVPKLLELARNPNDATRQAAFSALNALADPSHLPALVNLLADAQDNDNREQIITVFGALAGRAGDPAQLDLNPVVQAIGRTETSIRIPFLKLTSLFPDARLRQPLRSALKESEPTVRAAAERALCDTQDLDLIPDVLSLATRTQDVGLRSLALRGYTRLVCQTEGASLTTEQRAGLMRQALELASRPEDLRPMLSGLAVLPHPLALELTEKACANPAVQAEAELASLQIAKAIAAQSPPAEVALQRLASNAANENVRTEARALLRRLFTGWLATGPYRVPGKQGQELFDTVFPPEQADTTAVKWQRAPGSLDPTRPGELDLLGVAGGDHCILYVKTRVHVAAAQPVAFSIGSDDGIKLWLNGELIHANNAVRGLTPGQDRAKGNLREGWNDLLAKITQHTVGCGLNLRITTPEGQDIPNLRLNPQGAEAP